MHRRAGAYDVGDLFQPLAPLQRQYSCQKSPFAELQKHISVRRKSEKYPVTILLAAKENTISATWLYNNRSLLLIICLIPFGLGTLFIFLFLDSKKQASLGKKKVLQSYALEKAPFACMITDTDGNIVYVNKQFSVLFWLLPRRSRRENPRFLKSNLLSEKIRAPLGDTHCRSRLGRGTSSIEQRTES